MNKDSIPTPAEEDILTTLEDVVRTGTAQCKFCDFVVKGEDWGDILEGLAEHGEEEHNWIEGKGWEE